MDFIDEPVPLQVPPEFTPLLAAADSSTGPIDEIDLPHQLAATITPERELSEAERMAGGAEVSAWKFQRGNDGSGRTWGIYWSALTSWSKDGNTVHFPDIGFVDHNVIAYWIKRSDDATHPTIQARFADLAWEIGRHKKVGRITQDLARRAIDAYLQAVDRHLYANVTDAWLWLDRAIELADGIKDQVRFLSAREAAIKLFRSLSAAGKHSHDSHWRFDDILYGYKPKSLEPAQRQEVIDALELELQRRSDISNPSVFDPHTATDMADRLKRWRKLSGEAADATRATLTAGKAFEDASGMAAGLTAVLWLEDLFLRYREAGLHAEAARVEQTIRHRAIDARNEMTQASVPVDIPPEQIERWAEEVTGQNLQEGLSQIALQGLRKEAVTRDSVTKMMKESAFLPFMPITLAGPGGFTEATVGPLKDDPDGHAFLQAGRLLGWNSPFLNLAFRHVRKKYGITADHIIAHVRQCPFFAEERMPLLKAGIESWLADDHTSAVHILVPQVEAALRDCLISIGGVTLKPNKNGGFHVITMGDILTDPVFKQHFPGDLRFHLRALYTDTRGLNIRNHLAHGLMHPSLFGVGLANLVIHSILLIAELRLSPATQSSNSPAAQNGASTS